MRWEGGGKWRWMGGMAGRGGKVSGGDESWHARRKWFGMVRSRGCGVCASMARVNEHGWVGGCAGRGWVDVWWRMCSEGDGVGCGLRRSFDGGVHEMNEEDVERGEGDEEGEEGQEKGDAGYH